MTRLSSCGEFEISDDPKRMDVSAIHSYLTRSYWAEGIKLELVDRCIQGSLCLGLFHRDQQVGFARVVTDRTTFAYLCDVYVLEIHHGKGLGRWLIESVMSHPDLQGLRRFMLVTKDAHRIYQQFGFANSTYPDRILEISRPGLYLTSSKASDLK